VDDLNIAIVHKHFVERGGAERVAEELARIFDAPLYVGFSDAEVTSESDVEVIDLFDNSLAISLARRSGFFREVYSIDAWEHQPELASYDILIQTAPQPSGYVPTDDQTIIRYVHDLPRNIYDSFQKQKQSVLSRMAARIYRILYATYAPYADEWIVNSEYIQKRLKTYLDEDSTVVYPPVNVHQFAPQQKENFYLTYSRLTRRKRILDIVEVFGEMPDRKLIVGGTGPAEDAVSQRASELSNVEYRGYLSEEEKIDLLGRARAVVFGAETESFGMVPVEAFASGTPVIGANSGYTKYHVTDGENGILFDWEGGGLISAVNRFEQNGIKKSPEEISSESERFSRNRFTESIINIIFQNSGR